MSTKTNITNQMRNLISVLRQHNHLYYVMGEANISDDEYDQLRLQLIDLETKYPEYIQIDSPILSVGGKPEATYTTKEHTIPMLSLGNVFSHDELIEFISSVPSYNSDAIDVPRFILEHKFDGLACSIVYTNGRLTQALTRGDGKFGEDVTNKVLHISNVPTYIEVLKDITVFEVRGEVLMPLAGFIKYNEQALLNNSKPLANARNAAVGSLRQKSNDSPRPLAFYAYSINQGLPKHITTQGEVFLWLEDNGFSIGHIAFASKACDIQQYYESLITERDTLPYDIDGLVIKVDSLIDQNNIGNKTREPKWAVAYKFPAKHTVTLLNDVTWQVGRMGQLTPVGHVNTVPVGGVNISNVTLHNIAEIERLGIRIGDTVTLERAGDVIPKITKVWPELRPDDAQLISIPTHCPSCDHPIIPIEGDTMVFCMSGLRCPKQQSGAIAHFASRECMDIDGLASGIIDRLIDKGFLLNIADIYSLHTHQEELNRMDGFGEKSITKLLNSIESTKATTLQRFIYALGIRNVGEGTSIRLERFYKTLDKFIVATQEDLESIVDIGPITAAQIHQFLAQPDNITVIGDIINAGVTMVPYQDMSVTSKQQWCITGSFSESRSDIKKKLNLQGITITGSVSKNTDALLVGDNPGANKIDQATKLNIPLIYQF